MKRTSHHSSRHSSSSSSGSGDDRCNGGQRKKRLSKRAKVEQPPVSDEFPKLDQSDPVHARRIQQRRRMVAFGKNTVGYDEYVKQVPKHKRKPRCMKHPTTPDHTLDIPTKRWQGLVRAWRKALHQYDPEDLMKSFSEETVEDSPSPAPAKKDVSTVQAREIAQAAMQGLPVQLTPNSPPPASGASPPSTIGTEVSSVGAHAQESKDELDAWEDARRDNDHDFLLEDEDSDDDLL